MDKHDPLKNYTDKIASLQSGDEDKTTVEMNIGPFDVVTYTPNKWGLHSMATNEQWLSLGMLTELDGNPEAIKRIAETLIQFREKMDKLGYEGRYTNREGAGLYSSNFTKQVSPVDLVNELRNLFQELTKK